DRGVHDDAESANRPRPLRGRHGRNGRSSARARDSAAAHPGRISGGRTGSIRRNRGVAMPDPIRRPIDARIDGPGREGLTGTVPASVYAPLADQEQITVAPDGRPMEEQPPWRADFPIDWPQDEYVERRDFMKFLVLTSLAFTAGQFWIVM